MTRVPRSRTELVLLVVILAAYALSLGRTVDYGYVWDDVPEIQTNVAFDRPLSEGIQLTQVERGATQLAQLERLSFTYDSYRPVLFASYWSDIALSGRAPGPLHRTNVMLGALAILLAYLFARRWIGSATALVPTAIFALHPVQIETIAYVSARGDLLAGLFALAASYAVLCGIDAATTRRVAGWAVVACVAFAASLLSKESYVALPLALAVVAWGRPGGRPRWWILAALAAIAVGYLPLRAVMISVQSSPPYGASVAAFPATLLDYVRIIALPFDLSIERMPRTQVSVGWLVVGLVIALAAIRAYRVRVPGPLAVWTRNVIAGGAWLIVLLGPSAVVVSSMNVTADRYLYLPVLGLAVAITSAGARLTQVADRWATPIKAVSIGWAALAAFVAWRQVPVWRDTTSLYHHALAMEPASSRANYRVAVLGAQRGDWELAVPLLERAIELDPHNAEALNNLGVYHLRHARNAEAEALFRRAITANRARFNAWNNLGLALLAQGKRDAACASMTTALEINPGYEPARSGFERECANHDRR